MKTLKELCIPRSSIFDRSTRDTVSRLMDLIEDKINADDFFAENYLTDGMKRLLREAFRRFDSSSTQGVFVLTQAMGGGKTHNMISLGLLAKNPELRSQVMGNLYEAHKLGPVRVVAFNGRESDEPLGIWGAIAQQLGKKEQFHQYYSPLAAPGETAWVNLLKGDPLLILLDELPPYLDNAKSKQIGNSDLAQVTSTALANLLSAVAREDLANVCVVISDLKATYEGGSEQINKTLENLKGEVGRAAMTLEPVALNTDELYHILRKRLFEKLPDESEILEVARAYAKAVNDAKQMDITNASPEKFTTQLKESYPFHFAIRDLYARFRENPGFQQTRGLIRLMRVVTLVIYEPYVSGSLNPELQKLYDDLDYKNRILFLSGLRGTLETLLETAAELKAITSILDEMKGQKVPDNDPQRMAAKDMEDNIKLRLLSATREVFTTLYYPTKDSLMSADFQMNFTDNNYNGEIQIRNTLKEKQKFTEDISSDSFRKKCEQRLFTAKSIIWSEVKKRAATNTAWPWHRVDALDLLKDDLIHKDQWREDGGYVEKPPFPKPQTDIRIKEKQRNNDTGEVTLELTAVHGDIIHYDIGSPVTTTSQTVSDPKNFCTNELEINFLCVDSKGEHETGDALTWTNRITIKSRSFQSGNDKMVELKAAPDAPIRYTTDGSDPKLGGGIYNDPFIVPEGTVCILAVAEKQGISSQNHRLDIQWDKIDDFQVDPAKPAIWQREHHPTTTKDAYELIGLLKKYQVGVSGPRITVTGSHWVEISVESNLVFDVDKLESAVNYLRSLLTDGEVEIQAQSLSFSTGQQLLDWVAEVKTQIYPHEVQQQ
ncbi:MULTISPECIES: DUF499 domain-containing protein [unclassified Dolichospermum]|uniref:DUF499 domain-containing protein n=1 Tax=unclassified Dolichospermum TaxID=2622029 RepID=UPI001445A11A|nr:MULTISPECIES: DUF499 domain-containing protein [unclassified Dolichospermum]MTJ15832.1 DUF499 domain-containing protein [Dolichospermum sp. UHCC 0299]MTJ41601.1 DUF499 domain-containing protein [Dolichospermum sp. UHCC 0406]